MADVPDGRQQQHMMAAVYHLVQAIKGHDNTPDDIRKLLEDLDARLPAVVRIADGEVDEHREIEARLCSAHRTILSFHSGYSNIWDSSASAFLQAVADVTESIASLESTPLRRGSRSRELFDQAQTVQQIAMARLEKELVHILVQNKHCFERDDSTTPPAAGEGEAQPAVYEESVVSNEDESANVSRRESSSTEIEEYTMDLIHPDVIPHIRSIAAAMFPAGYGPEFCRAFTAFWRDVLAECLTMLDVEYASIEDVLQMKWKPLNARIKRWCFALRRFVGVYLGSAKRLFDQVLGDRGCLSSDCLIDASKPSLLRLLNFGQAVSIGPHQPEWLCCLLNMYEVLSALTPDLDSLFSEESDSNSNSGSLIKMEFHELLTRLGASAKIIFEEMGNHIRSCHSTTPYPNGGIPPLTKYLMNYILTIAEYGDTLNSLLQTNNHENSATEHDVPCTVGTHLQSWTKILEANLDDRGDLYNHDPLKHIFMMNSIQYMVRKIRQSEINLSFGDDWIRSHMVKYRQHARSYERATWGPILPLIHDDGKIGKALKAKCQEFASAFEDLYKNQTRWCVPDEELREELRISAAKTVIPAYRSFAKRVSDCIGEKHIKYSEQELENYILDLLEGSPKSLNQLRKK